MDLRDFDPWAGDEAPAPRLWSAPEIDADGEEPENDFFEADVAQLARRERRLIARLRSMR